MFDALKDASTFSLLVLAICRVLNLTNLCEKIFDEDLGILPFDDFRIGQKNSYLYKIPHME